MAEYIKCNGREYYLGVSQSLIRISYPKYMNAFEKGVLIGMKGNDTPEGYGNPDHNYFYRFPFPDEATLPFGEIKGDDYRGLPITIDRGEHFGKGMFKDERNLNRKFWPVKNPNCHTERVTLHLTSQRFIKTGVPKLYALALMWRCPYSREYRSIRDIETLDYLIGQIQKHYIIPAKQERKRKFWQTVVDIILNGYEPLRTHPINS